MKKFMMTAVLALIVIGTTGRAPVASDSKQTDGSFTTAQRYCPNGRC